MPDFNEVTTTQQALEEGQPMFQYNGRISNVGIDNALAAILDKFDADFIMSTIMYSIDHRFRPYDQPMPNMVYGYEQQFIELTNGFSSNQGDIAIVRQDTYVSIIDSLCRVHNLLFSNHDEIDYYSAAFYLYKFLISEFTDNIVIFYTNFLIKERVGIYNSLNLKDFKKNDIAMAYSNERFVSEKIGLIHGNIAYVMENIQSFDIDLYTILDLIYADKDISRYIFSIISDQGNFFQQFFSSFATHLEFGPELQTAVKLNLQKCAFEIVDID